MSRQFGKVLNEGDNPFEMDTERAWSEGTWGINRDRALESSLNKFAGLGMGFGGGVQEAKGDIITDFGVQRTDAFENALAARDELNQQQTTAFRSLEMERIANEQAARERQARERAGIY